MNKKITKSKLKAKMLEYFREVEKTGNPLIVTDYGKPVLKIVPFEEDLSIEDAFLCVPKTVTYSDDCWENDDEDWGSLCY